MNRKNNFDFMRVVAATLVVYSHSYALLGIPHKELIYSWKIYYGGGALGVAIFFVMSGYLIAISQQNSTSVLQFLSKRALRIFPALAVVVLLTAFVLGPLVTTLELPDYLRHRATREYLWNIALWVHFPLPGVFAGLPYPNAVNSSLWTLPVEVVMYVGVALLGLAGLLKRRWIPLVLIALVALYAYLPFDPSLQKMQLENLGQLDNFLRLAIYFFTGSALSLFDRLVPWRAWIAALLLIVGVAAFRTPVGIYCMFVAIPYCTLYIARSNFRPLANFGRYGDFSYGLYIYAFPIQQTLVYLAGRENLSPLTLFLAAQTIALGCAFLSWHLVEKPALRLKQRLPSQRATSAPMAARE